MPVVPGRRGDVASSPGQAARRGARRHPSQLALAWLMHRSPVMVPIPGTSSVAHLEENIAAAAIELTPDDIAALDALGG